MNSSPLVNLARADVHNQTREAVVGAIFVTLLPSIGLGISFLALGSVLGFRRPAAARMVTFPSRRLILLLLALF